ncbi:MAG: SprT family zinc-dependent metalloprotease [Pseudomonadota bacterium]
MVEKLVVGGDPRIEARVRRSAQARRLSLRVSRLDGRVTLSIPRAVPIREAEAFLRDRAAWLRQVLAEQPAAVTVGPGVCLPVGSDRVLVSAVARGPARLEEGQLFVRATRPAGPQVAAVLRARAKTLLEPACRRYSARIGRVPGRISLRDTRSRWGSCTEAGNLMFSWRLAMAPEPVLDYVAAHEVAHLREMNHSSRFWALVRQLCPEFERYRGWLHAHGAALHRYRFDGGDG